MTEKSQNKAARPLGRQAMNIRINRIDTISYGLEKAMGEYEGSSDVRPSWAHDRRDDFVYLSGGKQ
jgi:hypothetical protein